MKIFVAYGYNNRDKWIPDLVFPLIKAFGDQVVTGENIQGQEIPPAVQRDIQRCNALMAFATRRKKSRNGWMTHRWITDELALAIASNLPVVEIRETGVDDQGGIAGGRQRITYDENERDKCLVEIAKTLGNWHSRYTVEMQLLPDECVQAVRPLLRNPRFRCTYQILDDGVVGNEIKAEILPKPGGLFVRADNVSRLSAIQIRIECAAKSWSSDFSSVEYVGIHLRKD